MPKKPKPTRLKILAGNPGKRPLNKNEPEPDPNIPAQPHYLNDEALKEWDRITVELYNLGLLSNIDRTALAAYCQIYGRWVLAEKELNEQGPVIRTLHGNLIPNPLVGIVNTNLKLMHKYLTEFGMTPSSRSKVSVQKKESDKKSKWEKF